MKYLLLVLPEWMEIARHLQRRLSKGKQLALLLKKRAKTVANKAARGTRPGGIYGGAAQATNIRTFRSQVSSNLVDQAVRREYIATTSSPPYPPNIWPTKTEKNCRLLCAPL
ncbi:unnamed protein product [Ectocarpus sp. 12 AP-2014]